MMFKVVGFFGGFIFVFGLPAFSSDTEGK